MTDRNNGTTTNARNPDGTFASGNPGRPTGARHEVTRAVEALMECEAEELTRKASEMALRSTFAVRRSLHGKGPR